MPSRPKPRRPDPDVLPDSLPKGGEQPDIMPDDLRREDEPATLPDSVPRPDEGGPTTDTRPDGGVAQHPIHDEDQEDMGPDEFEEEFEEAAESGFEPESEESEDVEDAEDEFEEEELGPNSIPSLDRDRGPGR